MIKNVDELFGYVVFKEEEFPFHFSREEFVLHLYIPSKEKWYDELCHRFASVNNYKKNEWIPSIRIEGITTSNYKVCFDVLDSIGLQNGFLDFQVNWAVYYENQYELRSIEGIRFYGGDINNFYPAGKAFNTSIVFKESSGIEEFSVTARSSESLPCGKYRVEKHVDATLETNAFATLRSMNAGNPIDATSEITAFFPERSVLTQQYLRQNISLYS